MHTLYAVHLFLGYPPKNAFVLKESMKYVVRTSQTFFQSWGWKLAKESSITIHAAQWCCKFDKLLLISFFFSSGLSYTPAPCPHFSYFKAFQLDGKGGWGWIQRGACYILCDKMSLNWGCLLPWKMGIFLVCIKKKKELQIILAYMVLMPFSCPISSLEKALMWPMSTPGLSE